MGQVIPMGGDKHTNQRRALDGVMQFAEAMSQVVPQMLGQLADLRLSVDALGVWLQSRMMPDDTPQAVFVELHEIKAQIVAARAVGMWLHTMTVEIDKDLAWAGRIGTDAPQS